MEIVGRFLSAPAGSFFLFGPRGTGKSTYLREHFPGALYVDLLDPETFRALLARPERLRDMVAADPTRTRVVIDEVQKVPQLLDVVHELVETKRRPRLQFIVTGSSARKLKRTGIDLLAGRLLLKTMHPFMAAELGPRFGVRQSLELGMLPVVVGALDPRETLKSYVSLYLREEVIAEGLVRNVGDFSRFLEAISLSHASLLNTSEVARECQVGRKTAEGYLSILEDLLLGFRIQPFTKRARRLLVDHPKFYFADAGIFRSVRPRGPLDAPEEIGGACLEGLVAQHLRAWIAYSKGDSTLSFWRTKAGTEVDFVVYGHKTFAAVEVTHSRLVSSRHVKSLVAFKDDYPGAKVCLVYCGRERLKVRGVLCIPAGEFLAHLVPDAPLAID